MRKRVPRTVEDFIREVIPYREPDQYDLFYEAFDAVQVIPLVAETHGSAQVQADGLIVDPSGEHAA